MVVGVSGRVLEAAVARLERVTLFTMKMSLLATYKGGRDNVGLKSGRFTILTIGSAADSRAASCPTAVEKARSVRMHPRISNFVIGLYISRKTAIHGKRTLFRVSPARCTTTIKRTGTTIRVTGTGITALALARGGGGTLFSRGVVDSFRCRATIGRLVSTGTDLTRTRTSLMDTGRGLSFYAIADPSGNIINAFPCHVKDLIDPSISRPLAAMSRVGSICICFSVARGRLLHLAETKNALGRRLRGVPTIHLRLSSNAACRSRNGVSTIDNMVSRSANSIDVHTIFPGSGGVLEDNNANGVVFPCAVSKVVVVPRSTAIRVRSGGFIFILRTSGSIGGARVRVSGLSSKGGCLIAGNLGSNSGVIVRNMRGLRSNRTVRPVAPRRRGTGCSRTLGSRGRNGLGATFGWWLPFIHWGRGV